VTEFDQLHPSLQYHVVNTLGWSTLRPTQLAAIAPIHAGTHCLLLAPTAGGKTEAAAIPVLSRMLKQDWPATSVLYICPIKALLNNLEHRLAHYAGLVGRRVEVWHGDVAASRKSRALKDPPGILLTTPESVEAMLISSRVDRPVWFGNLQAVIVDELHAFASDDRGWHLRSILYRLDRYLERPLQRIGLSATVSNPEELLAWFAPGGERAVVGSASVSTDADVTIDFVSSLENAATVISRLHRGEKRLVFCDSRSGAERLSSSLRELNVRTFVSHASLSAAERRQAEAAFAEEKDCVIVATSTLELGIDVGDLDRVIQVDAPSSVSSFLQRMGRTGRRAGSTRNCLFLTTDDDALLLALGITRKWAEAWVEAAAPPPEPWHIVAQQAMAAVLEQGQLPVHELKEILASAFRELPAEDIEQLLRTLNGAAYLDESEGVVRVGPAMEREFGRGHYRDLLASFSGSLQLTGRYGNAEVGYIDPAALTSTDGERLVLLGGRTWRVTSIDWPKRTAWLEPATGRGRARWMGGPRSLGPEVCSAIRTVLVGEPPSHVQLSRRAKIQLSALTEELSIPGGCHYFVSRTEGAQSRTWTFAGTRINRTLARRLSIDRPEKARFDALGIQAVLAESSESGFAPLRDDEVPEFARSIKFAVCLPSALLRRVIQARYFDTSL
jgi:ATP-dependent helicase Lhr and Lhr-like helicase